MRLRFSRRDFDELMHLQNSAASFRAASLGFSPLSTLKCCLILPCPANEEEMLRVGRNIHGMLKVQGGLYYQVVDTPPYASATSPHSDHSELLNEDEKVTEERFRQFARYRVKEEEVGLRFCCCCTAICLNNGLMYGSFCCSRPLQRLSRQARLAPILTCRISNHAR